MFHLWVAPGTNLATRLPVATHMFELALLPLTILVILVMTSPRLEPETDERSIFSFQIESPII